MDNQDPMQPDNSKPSCLGGPEGPNKTIPNQGATANILPDDEGSKSPINDIPAIPAESVESKTARPATGIHSPFLEKTLKKEPIGVLSILVAVMFGLVSLYYTHVQTGIQREALKTYKRENEQQHAHFLKVQRVGEFSYRFEPLKMQDESQVLSISIETMLRDFDQPTKLIAQGIENPEGDTVDLREFAELLADRLEVDQGDPSRGGDDYTSPTQVSRSYELNPDTFKSGDFYVYGGYNYGAGSTAYVHPARGTLPIIVTAKIFYLGRESEVKWLFSLRYDYAQDSRASLPVRFGDLSQPQRISNGTNAFDLLLAGSSLEHRPLTEAKPAQEKPQKQP